MAQESFRHWQSISIEQKQVASSLLLGLSGAALGFSVSILPANGFYVGCATSTWFHICVLAHLASMACGVAFSINRVRDFDLTAQIARKREQTPNQHNLKGMRETVKRWGGTTRRLYVCQGVLFSVGAVGFVVYALIRYSSVLYPASG